MDGVADEGKGKGKKEKKKKKRQREKSVKDHVDGTASAYLREHVPTCAILAHNAAHLREPHRVHGCAVYER